MREGRGARDGGRARCGVEDEHECAAAERHSGRGVAVGREEAAGGALGGDHQADSGSADAGASCFRAMYSAPPLSFGSWEDSVVFGFLCCVVLPL